MRQTQLRLLKAAAGQGGDVVGKVQADAARDLRDGVVGVAGDARALLNGVADLGVGDAQEPLGRLARLVGRQVGLKESAQVLGHHALRDVVDVGQRILSRLEGLEGLELDDLGEAGQVRDAGLHLSLQSADLLSLDNLKQAIA